LGQAISCEGVTSRVQGAGIVIVRTGLEYSRTNTVGTDIAQRAGVSINAPFSFRGGWENTTHFRLAIIECTGVVIIAEGGGLSSTRTRVLALVSFCAGISVVTGDPFFSDERAFSFLTLVYSAGVVIVTLDVRTKQISPIAVLVYGGTICQGRGGVSFCCVIKSG